MYVIPEFKFCFLAAPRTASKAIAQALVEHRGAIKLGSHHDTPDDHIDYPRKMNEGIKNGFIHLFSFSSKVFPKLV